VRGKFSTSAFNEWDSLSKYSFVYSSKKLSVIIFNNDQAACT